MKQEQIKKQRDEMKLMKGIDKEAEEAKADNFVH